MAGTKREYERFMAWLTTHMDATDDVRRVANIVYAHFDAIEVTTTAQAQRSRTLAPYLVADLAKTDEILPVFQGGDVNSAADWVRLRQLVVGPFRGFQHPETFDLDKRIVLFYGPNGTGKTSLCEALEYCLLGEVAEAATKRIPITNYLRNVRTESFDTPRLLASDADGSEMSVLHDVDAFRFCFVEKNRIESFSRIASKTEAQRTELIATLFGLDGFTEFVRGFNNDIDGQLTLVDVKNQQLALKRAALANDNSTVLNEVSARAALTLEEAALAAAYEPNLTYAGLLTKLGTEDAPGRLQDLEQLLLEQIPSEWGITHDAMLQAEKIASGDFVRVTNFSTQLQQRSSDVNFKSLFEAVQGLEAEVTDRCPACDTPLVGNGAVLQNPFDKARIGLAELADLADLQGQHEIAVADASRSSSALLQQLRKLVEFARAHTPKAIVAIDSLASIPREPQDRWWGPLSEPHPEGLTKWDALLEVAHSVEAFDNATRQRIAAREDDIAERDQLNALNLKVAEQRTKQLQLTKAVTDALARIASFEEDNRDITVEVDQERTTITHHQRVQAAYIAYLRLLRAYRAGLPAALTADLNETALKLYNGFNRFDHEADKLAKLMLPADENQRIEVAYNSHPDTLIDALQVMSEGHIRCLGLAILVAKNLKLSCPVLIFDDAVNAVDTEHRKGIRDTLFDNPDFSEKQILITCHGEEFIKDIEVIIGNRSANESCFSYTFLPHEGDHVIRVVSESTRNYVLEAQQRFAAGRIRDAIASARRAMESVNDRTWALLTRSGQGELKLKMSRPRSPLDQNNLATVLKSALEKPAFVHERKARLLEGYTIMLGAREWGVFNPGTHEEAGMEDFDRDTVRQVIENLTALDDVLAGN